MKCVINCLAVLVGGLAWLCASSVSAADAQSAPAAKSGAQEALGIDYGSTTGMVVVARDKAAWDAALQAAGKQQMMPIGMSKGGDLAALGKIDFSKQMIVAVFWGEKSFSRQSEKCRIERTTVAGGELVVDCRATLWGGAVKAAYRAWPYHALVVDRSDLPVRFRQTTELQADPARGEKDKTLAVVPTTESKREFSQGK